VINIPKKILLPLYQKYCYPKKQNIIITITTVALDLSESFLLEKNESTDGAQSKT